MTKDKRGCYLKEKEALAEVLVVLLCHLPLVKQNHDPVCLQDMCGH